MNTLLGLICLAALVAGLYFLVRVIIALMRGQIVNYYVKRMLLALLVVMVSVVGAALTHAPKQTSSRQEIVATEQKSVEEKRLAEETIAEEKRIAEEKIAEEKRLAEETIAEEKRIAEEKIAEEKRIAEEKIAEEKRLAEEKAAEEKRIAEQQAAEKKAQEEAKQLARIADEKIAFQDWESKINLGLDSLDDHWETLWQYTLTGASNGEIGVQTVFLNLRELEHKLIDDEMIFYNATVPKEMSPAHSKKMNNIKTGLADWARLRRKGCENFRLAFSSEKLTPQTMQESLDLINRADALMLRSTAELVELENEFDSQ